MIVHRDALCKLHQLRLSQGVSQLILADKNDLQCLVLVCVDIGEHAQFFQCLGFHILCFVYDQHGAAVMCVLVNNELNKALVHFNLVHVGMIKVECQQYPLQQFTKRAMRVGDQANGMFPVHVVQQMADKGSLAGAYVTADNREAGIVQEAVLQHGKCHAVLVAHVQETRVGQQREGFLAEVVERFIHGDRGCRSGALGLVQDGADDIGRVE